MSAAAPAEARPQSGRARLLEVLGRDLARVPRRPLFWVPVVLLAFLAFMLSNGNAQIGSGDARVGGAKAFITSEFAVAQLLILLVSIVYSFFVAIGAGMTLVHDEDQNVGPLLHATRLTAGEYVWGKYLASLLGFVGVLVVHVGLMMLFNHVMPHGENVEVIGPWSATNYLTPMLVFALPMIILISGTSFAIGGLTRRAILVFLVPLGMLLFGVFFLWEWSPSWLSPELNRLLQFVDLSGLRWINETWLQVDRGVEYYNRQPVGLDGLVVAQRLFCVALGLGGVALVHARFPSMLRGSRAAGRGRRVVAQAAPAAAAREPAPLVTLVMSARAPGLLAAAWNVARVELRELRSHPGLYLFVPMILLETLGDVVSTGAFDTTILSTPGGLAVQQMGALTIMVCMLILFYTTESLQREKSAGVAPIFLAAPIPTAAILFGKALANVVVGLLVLLAALLGSVIILAFQGTVPIRLGPFALVWGLLLVPTFVLWTAFVCAAFTATGSRYATYALGLGAMVLTGWFQFRDKMTWLTNWDLWDTTTWSDISVLELDRPALVLNRLLALGLAVLFTVVAVRFFPRRERDASRVVQELAPARLARQGLRLAPWALAPAVLAVALGLLVHGGRGGDVQKKKARDYWKKNSATWRDAKLPVLASVDLDVAVDPATSGIVSRGTYVVVNRTADTLASVPLTGGFHWRNVRWWIDGDSARAEDRAGLHVLTPPRPLAPGDTMAIGFAFDGRFPDGVSRNGGPLSEFVLPSGVVLTGFASTGMAPLLGYLPQIGVEADRNQPDPRVYPADWYKRTLRSGLPMFDGWVTTRIRLTSPADLEHNANGVCISDSVAAGRRVTVWESDAPLRVFNVVMGRWKVKQRDGAAVHYDARHPYNVDEMLDALVAARRWYGEWFAPYPYRELRLSEFPGLATYAQAPPTNITFSENIGFLAKSEPKANAAFWIAAHEAAHQWWPLLVMSGDGPGGEVLSEGMAHFSTILLTEKARGLEQRMAFCRQIEDQYGNVRRRDEERPLVQMDGSLRAESRLIYDRGGFVIWMLYRLVGEEAGRAGLKDYIATYRDSEDHPLIEEFLACMRRHAPDPAAFDAFTAQWIFGTVVPQYLVADAAVAPAAEGDSTWVVTARVRNAGTGTAPVTLAAARGERFAKPRAAGGGIRIQVGPPASQAPYRDARTVITLGAGEERAVTIRASFEPERLVVDPDVTLLMLERPKATVKLKPRAAAVSPAAARAAPGGGAANPRRG